MASSKVSAHYADDAGAHYVAHYQSDPLSEGYAINLAYFEPYLKPSDVVLDFGCGNGGMLRLLPPLVARADGMEVNAHAASIAEAEGLAVYTALDQLPTEPAYDVVLSNHVLEHVRDVSSTLERVRQSMKPGALLLLKLPIDDWRTKHQRTWDRDDIDHHLQTWTPRLAGNVLVEAGFEVEEIRVITSAWDRRLFPLRKLGLHKLAFWALSVLKKRRQLFAVARVPHGA